MQPTLHPAKREHKLIFTAVQTNLIHLRPLAADTCPATTHRTFIRLLPTPMPAARTATAPVTILRNLTETVGSHSGEHEHTILCDVTPCSFDKHASEQPTLPAQERDGVRFSSRYMSLYQAKTGSHSKRR